MLLTLAVASMLLVAVTMGLSLAHALEFPGKLRLDESTYRTVQAIYYPGFTIGGAVGEFGGMLLLAVILFLTPVGSDRFWWTAAAFACLVAVHAIYWLVTHSVNSVWLKDAELAGVSRFFFGIFSARRADWRKMRNVWEWSHVARAVLAMLSFLFNTMAITR